MIGRLLIADYTLGPIGIISTLLYQIFKHLTKFVFLKNKKNVYKKTWGRVPIFFYNEKERCNKYYKTF
jgi:hypothetical protein